MGLFSKKILVQELAAIRFFVPDDTDDPDYCFIDLDIQGEQGRRCQSANNFRDTSVFDVNPDTGACEYNVLCQRLLQSGSRQVPVTWVIKGDEVKRCKVDYAALADAFSEPWLARLEEAGWRIL